MAFLDKTGLQTLTNKLVQGDAIKVASHRGKNVKEVIDNIQRECENVALPNTMTLENRISEFKVGESRDVDVSGDVEEGKVEVELQGKTYQNLIKENQSYTKDLVTTSHTGFLFPKYDLKSNVTYTIIFNVSNLVKDGNDSVYCIFRGNNDSNVFIQFDAFYVEKNGVFAQKFTLANGLKNFLIGVSGSSNKNNPSFTIGDIMILEGDYTQTPTEELPSYFEGIKSSFEDGIVDVEVQGKNLFDGSYRFGYLQGGDTPLYIDRDSGATRSVILKVKPNTTYNISKEYSIRNTIGLFKDYPINNTPYTPIPLNINGTRVNTGDNNYMVVYVSNESEEPWLQVEEGFVATPYEPYYKKKISFNIGESLRSLPNGVCDEIRNNNGQWELVRRVGKVVFDGSESWTLWYESSKTIGFIYKHNSIMNKSWYSQTPLICDRFISKSGYSFNKDDSEAITQWNANNSIFIRINKNSLETLDVNGFKQWLQTNPITVYYELETPIITPIEPIEFNISQGAVININSNISPASTHEVILNRAGQIEQGIQLIADLKSRINNLERLYDSNLIATQYKLDNLKLNYELEREED